MKGVFNDKVPRGGGVDVNGELKNDALFPQIFGTWTFGSVAWTGENGTRCSCGSMKSLLYESRAGSCCSWGTSAGLGVPAQGPHQCVSSPALSVVVT